MPNCAIFNDKAVIFDGQLSPTVGALEHYTLNDFMTPYGLIYPYSGRAWHLLRAIWDDTTGVKIKDPNYLKSYITYKTYFLYLDWNGRLWDGCISIHDNGAIDQWLNLLPRTVKPNIMTLDTSMAMSAVAACFTEGQSLAEAATYVEKLLADFRLADGLVVQYDEFKKRRPTAADGEPAPNLPNLSFNPPQPTE